MRLNIIAARIGITFLLYVMLGAIAQAQVSQDTGPHETNPSVPLKVGGDVTAPRSIYDPEPEYSEEARKAGRSGTCFLSLVVDADGKPQNVAVVRGIGMGLDENALAAVRTWRFEPARRSGVPVAVEIKIEVSFSLGEKGLPPELKKRMAAAQASAKAKDRELVRTMVNRVTEDREPRVCRLSSPSDNKESSPTERLHYRLRRIAFSNNRAFTNYAALRAQFPIKDGDPFNPALIGKGLENLHNAYATLGYISFAAVPETKFDDASQTVLLDVMFNEGKQFFVSGIDFLGLDEKAFEKMRKNLLQKPGQVYNQRLVDLSVARYASLFHATNPGVNLRPDNATGTVVVSYDFRPCQTE
jgi:TonB family protein